MAKRETGFNNDRVVETARSLFTGGVNSPARSFEYVGGMPIPIRSGLGSKVYDYNDKMYIDYLSSFGALILGHAHHKVSEAIIRRAGQGWGFGSTHFSEVKLADIIQGAIPFMERIRFTVSGTEAVMGAIRLARGFTGRDMVVKFENSYHGHADYLLAKSGSGLATMGIPGSKGVPDDFVRNTLVLPYGNIDIIEDVFDKNKERIAAVIVEPVGGNWGVIEPDLTFLSKIRGITSSNGTLLIFDEVITGFRFRFGSVSDFLGIEPDIICLGKIIGGGLPIGAYGGSKEIMKHLAPEGDVYQASTFSGNPLCMEAGIATLDSLYSLSADYSRLDKYAALLADGIRGAASGRGLEISIRRFKGIFSVHFKDKDLFREFYIKLLNSGILFAPSEFESNFISFAHEGQDIRNTVEAIGEAIDDLIGAKEVL